MSSNTSNTTSPIPLPTIAPTISTGDDEKFISSFSSAVPVFLVSLLCFLLCRKRFPGVYMSNWDNAKALEKEDKPVSNENFVDQLKIKSIAVQMKVGNVSGIFDVLKEIWLCDQEKIQDLAGFDAMVFTSMLFFMFKLFLILIPVTFVFLVPVYFTGEEGEDETLGKMSLSNIGGTEAWKVWFTLILAILLHVGSTWFLQENFRELSKQADAFNAQSRESRYTLLVENVPEEFRKGHNLYLFMDRLYPGYVANVDMCYDLKDIDKSWKKYRKAVEQRERCEFSERKQIGRFCFMKDVEQCKIEEEEAKLIFYRTKLKDLHVISAAIVQFRDMMTTTVCANVVLIPGGKGMKARAVPEFPEEILWRNLSRNKIRRNVGMIIGTIAYTCLIIFYTPVMVFIQGLANLDTLANTWSGVNVILNLNSGARAVIQGSLPGIVFSMFFVILPIFLGILSKLALPDFKTDESELTLSRYADCLIGMGLLVSVFSSGVLSSVKAISSLSADDIWETLGTEVPAQSVFFLTYIITACFMNMAMNLAMVTPFLKNIVGVYKPTLFNFEVQYGVMIFMFTIGLTYAVISPTVIVVGCVYFLFAYFTFTYQLIYVYKRGKDTGGRSFPAVYGRLNNGMVIGQLVIIAMMILQEAYPQAAIFFFVPLYTSFTKKSSIRTYGYYFGRTSLQSARESDTLVASKGGTPIVEGHNSFLAPSVKALMVCEGATIKSELEMRKMKSNSVEDESSDSTDILDVVRYGSVNDNQVYL